MKRASYRLILPFILCHFLTPWAWAQEEKAAIIVEKARIKIGTRLYSKGLSLTHSADLSGATGVEILTFSGKTRVHEESETRPVRERLEVARKIFR